MARILIAEDDVKSKELLQRKLEEWSYDVVATSDGSQALAKAESEDFDLLVTDWMMPELNGVDLCRTLKADEKTRDLPVIMLTTKKGDVDKDEAYAAGVCDFVTKPFDRDDFKARIAEALAN